MNLQPEEQKLLEFLRDLKWGEATVKVRDSKPVMVTKGIQEVKLTDK